MHGCPQRHQKLARKEYVDAGPCMQAGCGQPRLRRGFSASPRRMRSSVATFSSRSRICSLPPIVLWSGRVLLTTSRMRCASGEGRNS